MMMLEHAATHTHMRAGTDCLPFCPKAVQRKPPHLYFRNPTYHRKPGNPIQKGTARERPSDRRKAGQKKMTFLKYNTSKRGSVDIACGVLGK